MTQRVLTEVRESARDRIRQVLHLAWESRSAKNVFWYLYRAEAMLDFAESVGVLSRKDVDGFSWELKSLRLKGQELGGDGSV